MSMKKLIAAAALAVAGIAGSATAANAAPVTAGAATLTVSMAAAAQDWRHRDSRYDRGNHRGWDRNRHYNRSRYSRRPVCRVEYRHHRRVTVCYRR